MRISSIFWILVNGVLIAQHFMSFSDGVLKVKIGMKKIRTKVGSMKIYIIIYHWEQIECEFEISDFIIEIDVTLELPECEFEM
jgi:hypothetical protein